MAWFAGLTRVGAEGVGGGGGAVTVSVAVRVAPPKLAVIVTGVERDLDVGDGERGVCRTRREDIVAGTLAALPPLETVTAAPPAARPR